MSRSIPFTLVFAVLLGFGWVQPSAGVMPDGTFLFDFGNDDPIYDFGNFGECDTLVDGLTSLEVCIAVMMLPDGRGRYQGTTDVSFDGTIEGVTVVGTLSGPASGKIRGKDDGDPDRAAFKARTTGNLTLDGFVFESDVSMNCKGVVDGTGLFDAFCRGRIKVIDVGSAPVAGTFTGMIEGGAWNVMVDVEPLDEKTLGGTATDSFGYQYEVKGKYNANTDTAKLKLKGLKDTDAKGARIQLENLGSPGGDVASADAKYKVQGHKGSAQVETD